MKPNAEIPISVEFLRMILDLPPEYRIVGAFTRADEIGHTFRLTVVASQLPATDDAAARHQLLPMYSHANAGRATLSHVDVRLAEAQPPTAFVVWEDEDGG